MIDGESTNNKIIKMATYLPKTILRLEIGFVMSNSKVPDLNSSESERIEIAGIKNIKTQGANSKNLLRVANPKSSILLSCKTNKKIPLIKRNNTIAI